MFKIEIYILFTCTYTHILDEFINKDVIIIISVACINNLIVLWVHIDHFYYFNISVYSRKRFSHRLIKINCRHFFSYIVQFFK